MPIVSRLVVIATSCAILSFPATAQAPSAPAELKVATKGVFNLQVGESTDLTDRGILLHLSGIEGAEGEQPTDVLVTINGGYYSVRAGYRWNLKEDSRVTDFVKDLRTCVLDVVGASKPVGAPASAKFRILCE